MAVRLRVEREPLSGRETQRGALRTFAPMNSHDAAQSNPRSQSLLVWAGASILALIALTAISAAFGKDGDGNDPLVAEIANVASLVALAVLLVVGVLSAVRALRAG